MSTATHAAHVQSGKSGFCHLRKVSRGRPEQATESAAVRRLSAELSAAEESLAEVQAQMLELLAGYHRLGADVEFLESQLWNQVLAALLRPCYSCLRQSRPPTSGPGRTSGYLERRRSAREMASRHGFGDRSRLLFA